MAEVRDRALAFAGVCLLVFGFGIATDGYKAADSSGWVRHSRDTNVVIGGEWMVGEYRDCNLEPHGKDGAESVLFCWGGSTSSKNHELPILYWGRIDRTEPGEWRCQRESASLICKAVS